MSGPASSWNAPIPSDAARRIVASCAARRWAGDTEEKAARRTTWCASVRNQPVSSYPAAVRASGTRASSPEETTAECTSTRER